MKRKIALFLAAIMAFSPVSVFATSDNSLSKAPSSVIGKSLFMEEDWNTQKLVNLKATEDKTKEIEYVIDGTTLYIKPTNGDIKEGHTIKIQLENAKWFFRHNTVNNVSATMGYVESDQQAKALYNFIVKYGQIVPVTTGQTGPAYNNKLVLNPVGISQGLNSSWFENLASKYIVATELSKVITNNGTNDLVIDLTNVSLAPSGTTVAALLAETFALNYPISTKDFTNKRMLERIITETEGNVNFTNGTDELTTYDVSKGIYYPQNSTYVKFNNFAGGAGVPNATPTTAQLELAYTLSLSNDDDNTATIRFYKDFRATDFNNFDQGIPIPLVSLSEKEGDVRVKIGVGSNLTPISSTNLQYGLAASDSTTTYVSKKVDAKYNFPLDRLEVKEKIPFSIQRGKITFTAPYGYYFADPKLKLNADKPEDEKLPVLKALEDIFFEGNVTEIENEVVLTNNGQKVGRYIDYAYELNASGGPDFSKPIRDKIVINTDTTPFVGLSSTDTGLGLLHSARTNGVLAIEGLVLIAQDYAPLDQEIKIHVIGDGVSEEEFTIGTRKEWGVKFERLSEITKLIAGRFEDEKNKTEFDKEHKTAKVKFSEVVIASWWGQRETEFTLTEGVKFRKVKIEEEENFNHINTSYILNGTYLPKSEKINYVSLDSKRLKITDLAIKRDKKSSFEMQIWVSIEPGFEGDINIMAGGSDALEKTTPLKIATALSPITLKTEVKDVKIGYQWQKVADFTITETAVGMLKRGTEVNLFIDDDISGNDRIVMAPDFITEVNTDSNILFSKPVISGGEISFTIDRNSYGKPATIRFSNVYVKIDRTVPESNKRPYKIVAGGTAIAANYAQKPGIYEAKFQIKGIGADYLNVVTSANDRDSVLSNIVKVEIGSNEVKIGREGTSNTVFMDTAAYISSESNSTMVPVRFVSQALGIPDNQILWDNEARTVTIYNGSRIIQFTVGSSDIIINGVTATMYSPDMTPLKVKAEVKDNRAFLPFRALGNALGVSVEWEPDSQTAIYNADLLEKNEIAQESSR